MYHKPRFIYKYERKTSVLISKVSSWSTLDVVIVDFQNGLLAAKQIVKLWPEWGFEWRQTSFPCFQMQNPFFAIFFACQGKLLDFFFDAEYKIVVSMPKIFLKFFYFMLFGYHTFLQLHIQSLGTASTMPSFLLFTPNNLIK